MDVLALLISVIALILAYSAYRKSGGSTEELKSKVEDIGITTESLRLKTADLLNRLEKTVRGENKKVKDEAVSEEIIEEETVQPESKKQV
jgi:hypothetical protein